VNPWQQRARRARFLADGFEAAREILTFYAGLAEWQGSVAPGLSSLRKVSSIIPSLLDYTVRSGPPALAQGARDFDLSQSDKLLRDYWETHASLSMTDFFARAALQPYAANLPEGLECPWCAQPPQAGCLKPQGDGMAFEVVCSLCLRRRSFPRTRCPGCDASSESQIASFSAAEFPHMRLLACDTCKGYILIVDLERDLAAIPEVDELAALSLALWAVQSGYHKLQPNLAGV
jgi:formate dehydrogenase maturation protein FdhE